MTCLSDANITKPMTMPKNSEQNHDKFQEIVEKTEEWAKKQRSINIDSDKKNITKYECVSKEHRYEVKISVKIIY